MSALQLERPNEIAGQTATTRPRVRHKPIPEGMRVATPKRAVKRNPSRKGRSQVLSQMVTFCFIASAVFGISSLSGQVMVEKARHEKETATSRTREAQRSEVALRQKLDELTSADRIQEWATAHGFQPADLAPVTPSTGHSGGYFAYAR